MKGFEDLFAYAVEVARLRDGLTGSVEFLRETQSTTALVSVLSERARKELSAQFSTAQISIEEYNEAWAATYLAQVERGESNEQTRRGSS